MTFLLKTKKPDQPVFQFNSDYKNTNFETFEILQSIKQSNTITIWPLIIIEQHISEI